MDEAIAVDEAGEGLLGLPASPRTAKVHLRLTSEIQVIHGLVKTVCSQWNGEEEKNHTELETFHYIPLKMI